MRLPTLKVKMESFVRMMHLGRYEGMVDDGNTIDGTGLSEVKNNYPFQSELKESFQETDGNNF